MLELDMRYCRKIWTPDNATYLNDFADRVIGLVDANISAIKDFEKED